MRATLSTGSFLLLASSLVFGAQTPNRPPSAHSSPAAGLVQKSAANAPASALKKFLLSTDGTYGWSPVKGTTSYDFLPDGRLHIQGPDGEATMWEGKWRLEGDRLTLINPTLEKTQTVTAAIDGADLLLDGKRYRRAR